MFRAEDASLELRPHRAPRIDPHVDLPPGWFILAPADASEPLVAVRLGGGSLTLDALRPNPAVLPGDA